MIPKDGLVAVTKRKKLLYCPCALTEHYALNAYRGSGGIAPLILWPRHCAYISKICYHTNFLRR